MHEVYDQDGESVLTVAGYESACDAAMALNAADRKATLRERARVRAKAKKARGR